MQITHEEARRLIHFASDETLKTYQKEMLDSHLASCRECQEYAESTKNMESVLRPLLQKQWNRQPPPLSMDALLLRQDSRLSKSMLLATRIAAVGVMFVVFMFSAWQFALSKPSMAGSLLASVPPIPIPSTSTQLVSTKMQSKACDQITYIVKENDTLVSIAAKFSMSREDILNVNNLKTEIVTTGMKLSIPVCNFTPTGTINTLTTTFTPVLHTITLTPGG
jgi:LysM repeat protein